MKDVQSVVSDEFDVPIVGSLSSVCEFRAESKLAKTLPANLPVLTCILDQVQYSTLVRSSHCVGFGMGRVPLRVSEEQLVNDRIMAIRIQIGGTQVHWLADLTDPELQTSIDAWASAEKLPFALTIVSRKTQKCFFGMVDFLPTEIPLNQFRFDAGEEMSRRVWDKTVWLATCGIPQMAATTDIPRVALKRVFVNVLMTSRLQAFAKAIRCAETSVFTRESADGVNEFH
jgi:hypothetical protein